jgi:hypothetical protein
MNIKGTQAVNDTLTPMQAAGCLCIDVLKDFLGWYANRFGSTTTEVLLTISMAGHFHIHTKQAKELIRNCRDMGFVNKCRECLTIKV